MEEEKGSQIRSFCLVNWCLKREDTEDNALTGRKNTEAS